MKKTVFIRALEALPSDKPEAVLRAVIDVNTSPKDKPNAVNVFKRSTESFSVLPGNVFAYWASETVLGLFESLPSLNRAGRIARTTNPTTNDFRFARGWWEIDANIQAVGRWKSWNKGGGYSPFYRDIDLVIDWDERRGSYRGYTGTIYRPDVRAANLDYFFRPGLTWVYRGARLCVQVMPSGTAISTRGNGLYARSEEMSLFDLALLNSAPADYLVKLSLGRGGHPQFDIADVSGIPVPPLTSELRSLALRSWQLKRRLDTRTENSHAFLLPALRQVGGEAIIDRAQAWGQFAADVQADLEALEAEIDEQAFRLYGISAEDRQRIEQGFGTSDEAEGEANDNDGDDGDEADDQAEELDAAPMVASLLSWTVGVAFGRFDVRLATGDRAVPPEPEPFDPLPVCSAGMLTGDDGLPLGTPPTGYPLTFPPDGILVDDPGHPRDLVGAVRSVFDVVFKSSPQDANARWHEASDLLGAQDLRSWFAHDFFEPHIKRYSKSRRKAPIYWQLGTASGSYSVWLYIHRATSDTLFKVLNDFVGPKLDHEKSKLDGLTQEAGASPSASQRREIDQQETFVGELQALKTEVARVAPLWTPNLDDGVILNFAPLWRLVPQSRSWQAECKKAWDKLQAGDYEWAHLAMHLWPERVVPKCIDDRSIAIAHGLEAVFWEEDTSGTWQKSEVDEATVHSLIATRTSSSVKAALKDLLSAPTSAASKGRTSKARSPSPRTTAPKPTSRPKATAPEPKAPAIPSTAPIAVPFLDPATLDAVKSAIASIAGGASKADVLTATGLSESEWNKAITALLDRGEVTRTGQKRGTRYHAQIDIKEDSQ